MNESEELEKLKERISGLHGDATKADLEKLLLNVEMAINKLKNKHVKSTSIREPIDLSENQKLMNEKISILNSEMEQTQQTIDQLKKKYALKRRH